MALKPCKECGAQVSTKAAACPSCGHPIARSSSGGGIGCLSVIVIGGLLVFIMSLFDSTDDVAKSPDIAASQPASPGTPKFDEDEVRIAVCNEAQEVVKQQLKSPASAKFPGCVFDADQWDIRITPDHKTAWAMSYVDSQNSFGAMLRSKFAVQFSVELTADYPNLRAVKVAVE